MTTFSRTQLPKPSNFQDFERQCAILWENKLGDKNLQRYGRNGQRQNGVDIYGIRDNDPLKGVGIQCKLKDGHAQLTETEVRRECAEALKFRPPLTEFHILTTSPTDAKLQTLAAELTIEQIGKGRSLKFYVAGWNNITDEVGRYPDALLAFDESYGPFGRQTIERIDSGIDIQHQTRREISIGFSEIKAMIQTPSSHADNTVAVALAVESQLDSEIDAYRDMIVSGQWHSALLQLHKVLNRVRESASGRILFRIKTNIGACLLNLGDEKEATNWFLEAFDHAPEEPKAIANKALAHLLLQEWNTILEMGKTNLHTEAADKALSSHVIQAARFKGDRCDPLSLIPEKDRDTDVVLIALTLYQRAMGDSTWRETARTVKERFSEQPIARQLAAEALLDKVLADAGFVDQGKLSSEDRKDLLDASNTLKELWADTLVAEGKFSDMDIALCGNLIVAFRALGDYSSALEIIKNAMGIEEFSTDDDFVIRAAAVAMEAGDPILEQIRPKISHLPSRNLITIQIAVSKGDWESIMDFDPGAAEDFPIAERAVCRTAVRLAKIWQLSQDECKSRIVEIIDETKTDPRSSVMVAQYCRVKGLVQLAEEAWTNAYSQIDESAHISSRMMAAIYASRNGLWSDVASLLTGHVATHHDNEELQQLATALLQERPIKQRAVDFFEILPPQVRRLPSYRYFEGVMNFNRGDMPTAEKIFAEAVEEKANLGLIEMMAMVLRRQNRASEIPGLLAAHDLQKLKGTPAQKMSIAHELKRVGRVEEALEFAYLALRENPNDSDVNLAYVMLVFSIENLDQFISTGLVADGNWIRLTRENDKDYEFLVEEGASDPSGGHLSISHPMVALAAGKCVGESFSIPQQFGDDVIWTVAEIKHRYLHAFHDVLANFGTRFPTAKGLYSFKMRDDDISSMLEQIRVASESAEKSIEAYAKHGLPLEIAAGLFNKNPIDFAGGVVELDYEIRCCSGADHERQEATSLMEAWARNGVVLDTHTVWTAATLDILDVISELLGPIHIAQSTRDDLLEFLGFDDFQRYPAMSVFHRRGQFFRQEHEKETIEARNEYVRQQIGKIEKASKICPVVAPDRITPFEEMILEKSGEKVLDAIYLAGQEYILLSEDLKYRHFAIQTGGVKGLWLQAVVFYARNKDLISEERYAEIVCNLSALRHAPLALDAPVLANIAKLDEKNDLRAFEKVALQIGNPSADYLSHCNVVAEFILMTSRRDGLDPLSRQRAISILLRNLIRHTGLNWPLVVAAVEQHLDRDDQYYVYGWMKGHFLQARLVDQTKQKIDQYARREFLKALRAKSESSVIEAEQRVTIKELGPTPFTPNAPKLKKAVDLPRHKRRRKRRR